MKKTTDVSIMEKWIKERNGVPAVVKGTQDLIRVKFDPLEDQLEEMTWAKFFETFRENKLEFLYEDDLNSRFCKFISRTE